MTWILTASGRTLDFLNPQPDQIDILDIAQGLANECRFSGQCKVFYSVAQHCVLASQFVDDEKYAFEALMHDASEAYLRDIPRPLKALLPDYRAIEARLNAVIRAKFGLPEPESAAVKHIDIKLLATEKRDLMPKTDDDWGIPLTIRPLPATLRAVHSGIAQAQFVRRYLELTQKD